MSTGNVVFAGETQSDRLLFGIRPGRENLIPNAVVVHTFVPVLLFVLSALPLVLFFDEHMHSDEETPVRDLPLTHTFIGVCPTSCAFWHSVLEALESRSMTSRSSACLLPLAPGGAF